MTDVPGDPFMYFLIGIIKDSCKTFERLYKASRKRKLWPSEESQLQKEYFFLVQSGYLDFLDIDGKLVVERLKERALK